MHLERYTANLALRHPWITRTKCKIPMTPLEEVRIYQDMLKLKKIVIASFQMIGLVPQSRLQERYIRKITDPNYKDIDSPKKNHSVASIDLKLTQKSIINSRQVSISYGKHLNVPGKKNISASSSPRDKEHRKSKSISSSPSPGPIFVAAKIIPRTANPNSRPNQNDYYSK